MLLENYLLFGGCAAIGLCTFILYDMYKEYKRQLYMKSIYDQIVPLAAISGFVGAVVYGYIPETVFLALFETSPLFEKHRTALSQIGVNIATVITSLKTIVNSSTETPPPVVPFNPAWYNLPESPCPGQPPILKFTNKSKPIFNDVRKFYSQSIPSIWNTTPIEHSDCPDCPDCLGYQSDKKSPINMCEKAGPVKKQTCNVTGLSYPKNCKHTDDFSDDEIIEGEPANKSKSKSISPSDISVVI